MLKSVDKYEKICYNNFIEWHILQNIWNMKTIEEIVKWGLLMLQL